MQNAITGTRNRNGVDFIGCNKLIPLFHTRKHKKGINKDSAQAVVPDEDPEQTDKDMNMMLQHLNKGDSEFILNVLFYIAGYLVFKLIDNSSC